MRGHVLRSRARFLIVLLAAAAPAVAHAQEPQPWTNTSAYGDRVAPALPSKRKEGIVLRLDGGTGSTKEFQLSDTRGGDPDGEKTTATFLAGRSGVSYGQESWEVFATSYAYRVSIPKLPEAASNQGPLAADPYTQAGDVAIGGRWTKGFTYNMSAGVEGGAVLLGATGEPGNTGLVLAGPALSATSPFVRGLFTWQSTPAAKDEDGRLTASVNLGVFADQSWKVWEQATKEAKRPDARDEPFEEERIAMSFYGDKGAATRLLFGANVCYDVSRVLRPFLEVTAEQTSPDLTMRLSPGVAVRPSNNLALFVSADMDLSGDPEVSPRAPAFRANAGLQVSFGPRIERIDPGPRTGPTPKPTPPVRRGGYNVGVRVVDEKGRGIERATVRVYQAVKIQNPDTGVSELAPLTDDLFIAEGLTNGDGAASINTDDKTRNMPIVITARHDSAVEWVPLEVQPRSQIPPIVLYRDRTAVSLQFTSCSGQSWTPPPGSRVTMVPTSTGQKRSREWSAGETMFVPANNEQFKKWRIAVKISDWKTVEGGIEELPPPAQSLRVYVDPEKKCADFQQGKCCGAAPIATPPPSASVERTSFAIFEGDEVDVKPEEAMKLLAKLQPILGKQPHRVVVQAKKGDPIFQSALAGARRDALLAWLNGKGVPGGTVRVETDSEAKNDQVILEVTK